MDNLESPRMNHMSPGLVRRTPRPPVPPAHGVEEGGGSSPRSFNFSETNRQYHGSGLSIESSDEDPKEKLNNLQRSYSSGRRSSHQSGGASPFTSLIVGAGLTAVLFIVLVVAGLFNKSGAHQSSPVVSVPEVGKRGLRGSDTSGYILTSSGEKIRPSREDHHKSRVLMVPALEPFSRRNVHHYSRHDPKGKLLPADAARTHNKLTMRGEHAKNHKPARRTSLATADDVLRSDTEKLKLAMQRLPRSFLTSGVAKDFHSITGVDKYHHFDVNDYFGSSVTMMKRDARTGLVTVAVGAPGALENSGMIYFLTLNKKGEVDSYSYLTNAADDSLGDFWSSNVALGWAVENIGDLDGDGIDDLAVGAIGYPHGSSLGAVYILFMDKDNEIKSHKVITTGESGFTTTLKENTCFGSSLARLGDLDGDGVTELAVGAMGLGKQRGGVFILYLNKDGSVKKTVQISSLQSWDHKLNVEDQFGHAVRAIGDLDGDGITELAVGADGFPSGEFYGSVYILFLQRDGTVRKSRRIDELDDRLRPESLFGGSIDTLGDINGDGLPEIVVGAPGADDFRGDAFIISLNKDGSVASYKSLVDDHGPLSDSIKEEDEFAWSLCSIGDLNGDGAPDLAIGAETSPSDRNYGSLHVVFLTPNS